MENRKIRKYLMGGGIDNLLILSPSISVDEINSNLSALRVVSRYNQMQRYKQEKELYKTHKATPVFNMLGQFTGVKIERK